MANEIARTHTVLNASSAAYAFPTNHDSLVGITNIGANVVWICHAIGGTAAAEASNCEPILAGATVYVVPDYTRGLVAIAATADTKITMCNALGRTRL
jgi:hypothetical protein